MTAITTITLYCYPRIHKNSVNAEAKKHSTELNQYNKYIKKYAEEIRKLGLSDLETIIKVMHDCWESVDGYATEEEIILGYHRLTFLTEGKGVCHSFADDFTATINQINPKYNAENIIVYLNENETKDTEVLPITRNVLEGEEEQQ